jgi:peptidoglycan hydrolase-like protein with peptidoglycan-binding domain
MLTSFCIRYIVTLYMKTYLKKLITISALVTFLIVNISSSKAQNYGDYNDTTSINSCINLSFNLKFRSKDLNTNGEVSDLQSFLQDKGYLSSDPTGFFGRLTENAVQSYQSGKGFAATGFVGQYTREQIKSDSCRGGLPGPIACTMEMRYCLNGQPMQRDFTTCRWKEELCSNQSNLQDYNINLSIYSSNLNKYLTKNNSGYFDATDVDGNTSFQISTSNNQSNNIMCSTQSKTNDGYYSNISSSMNFSQNYDRNGTGLDYYKVSCGDGINSKRVEQEFIVETRYPTQNNINYCPIGQSINYMYRNGCVCPLGTNEVNTSGSGYTGWFTFQCNYIYR